MAKLVTIEISACCNCPNGAWADKKLGLPNLTYWCKQLEKVVEDSEEIPSDCPLPDAECDHNWKWVDDSFDHELGVELCGHYECDSCGEVDSERHYEYEPMPDDVI